MRNYEAIEYFAGKLKDGTYVYKEGKLINTYTGKEVKGSTKGKGNYKCLDSASNGVRKRAFIHLVIFAYFHGIEELKKYEVLDHVNGDKYDNRIENLQGMTRVENSIKSAGHKLTVEEVKEIKSLIEEGYGGRRLGKMFEVSESTIRDIRKGVTFKYV